MSGQHSGEAPHLTCVECQRNLQDYLDGGLDKSASMKVYLHVKNCADCTAEMTRLEQLVALLEALPEREPPADFDARILASVPYDSYRAMAGLRGARVPVFLAEDSLPAWVRSPKVRYGGVALAAVAVAGQLTGLVSGTAVTIAVTAVGLLPEITCVLQGMARRLVLAVGHSGESA